MDETFIMRELTRIFREVFDDPELELTAETSAKDIPAWDSVINVTLLIEIEARLNIRFATSEMEKLRNVGELAQLVAARSPASRGR
ncbi:MAG TPA: acyl carrier protein [Acetobacteraceae bacterium]|jgi:acyl carrier protein|nr:acyl carrier protein [Acetobacteraceae bacterium]